ncbi:metallophosphoesterase [Dysgonomonas sp. 521]|uniref:metallophosphoesterase family protein n=1 Tax=Dysgonomonas sp. 521 TaxID=2302932 RepID=UPI0013D08BEE|nr:metallophosphoesterase [Dysgonomonas sp. 521]NDV95557.1 metallophosphoesterase [Dysgonomonas sp. 521]
MRKTIQLLFLCILFILQSCEMIEYHPYDGRITGETDINKKNIKRIEAACKDKETIRFAMIGDTQRCYNETEDFVKALNKRDDIDFVIHGGDISDFGVTKEFLWQRDMLNKLSVPYVVLLGNHDCLANGVEVFQKVFGEVNFSFIAGRTKFVCLNTNALEFDYSLPVPDFQFIEEELKSRKDEYEKTIFAMHVRPFNEQFNNNVANVFQRYIKEYPNLQFCLNAHDHHVSVDDLFEDGVIYYGTPNIGKKQYFLFTLNTDNTYNYEVVSY